MGEAILWELRYRVIAEVRAEGVTPGDVFEAFRVSRGGVSENRDVPGMNWAKPLVRVESKPPGVREVLSPEEKQAVVILESVRL